MSSNYEWQKFEAKKRVDGLRNQADAHRRAKQGAGMYKEKGSLAGKASLVIVAGVALLVIGFLLTSCQVGEVPVVEASSGQAVDPSTDERIRVQDKVAAEIESERVELVEAAVVDTAPQRKGPSMVERIRFQDKLDARYDWRRELMNKDSQRALTMAERIRFQDKLDARYDWTRELTNKD